MLRTLVLILLLSAVAAAAEPHYTANFVITAENPKFAIKVGKVAEHSRKSLAIMWLGEELPAWKTKCPIKVESGRMICSGTTTFTFDGPEVTKWDMVVRGSEARILDSVVPHEVCHTVFATHFLCPLPRWADEGAASLAEYSGEQQRILSCLPNPRMPLNSFIDKLEYPQDPNKSLNIYAEGLSLTNFFVREEGHRKFILLLKDAPKYGWDQAIERNSKFDNISDLEAAWRK